MPNLSLIIFKSIFPPSKFSNVKMTPLSGMRYRVVLVICKILLLGYIMDKGKYIELMGITYAEFEDFRANCEMLDSELPIDEDIVKDGQRALDLAEVKIVMTRVEVLDYIFESYFSSLYTDVVGKLGMSLENVRSFSQIIERQAFDICIDLYWIAFYLFSVPKPTGFGSNSKNDNSPNTDQSVDHIYKLILQMAEKFNPIVLNGHELMLRNGLSFRGNYDDINTESIHYASYTQGKSLPSKLRKSILDLQVLLSKTRDLATAYLSESKEIRIGERLLSLSEVFTIREIWSKILKIENDLISIGLTPRRKKENLQTYLYRNSYRVKSKG